MIEKLNNLSAEQAEQEFFKCCGSTTWAKEMAIARPFTSLENMFLISDTIWSKATEDDGLEAFTHHPKIGDRSNLEKKFASTSAWAGNEQAGVKSANDEVITLLAEGNQLYEKKFGFIFIVCATGKSAQEMLDLLNARIGNNRSEEIKIAMEEQNKITKIRLEKLIA